MGRVSLFLSTMLLTINVNAQIQMFLNPKNVCNYSAELCAVIARAQAIGATLPSTSQLTAMDVMITSWKSSGAWDAAVVIYVFDHNGSKSFGTINWKNPGTYDLTEVGTVTFTSNVGVTSTSTSNYFKLAGINQSSLLGRDNSWIVTLSSFNPTTTNRNVMGAQQSIGEEWEVWLDEVSGADRVYMTNGSSSSFFESATISASATKSYGGFRSSTSLIGMIAEGGSVNTTTNTYTNAASREIYFLCTNNNNTPSSPIAIASLKFVLLAPNANLSNSSTNFNDTVTAINTYLTNR